MIILLKVALVLLIAVGMLVIACNYKAADDGDKKAKKHRNIGFVMFLVGEAVSLSLRLFGVL